MDAWILIIALFSPTGEWQTQYAEGPLKTEQECKQRAKELKYDRTKLIIKGICVTHEHWTGKKYMPGVGLD